MIKTILLTILTSSGIIGITTGVIIARIKKKLDDNKALQTGMQALLRHELYELHHQYCEKLGYAPVSVKEDFENMYTQYHNLGQNGVMDGIREEFQKLPTQKKD